MHKNIIIQIKGRIMLSQMSRALFTLFHQTQLNQIYVTHTIRRITYEACTHVKKNYTHRFYVQCAYDICLTWN